MRDWTNRIERINNIANECGYEKVDHQENICMLSYTDSETRINIYYSKMTVAIIHKKKPTEYKYSVGMNYLEEIFDNPTGEKEAIIDKEPTW